GNAMHVDPAQGFARRQARLRIIVELAARDDMHVPSQCGKVKREAAHDLAGRGMIGKEEAIEEDDALHLAVSARRNIDDGETHPLPWDTAAMRSIPATDVCNQRAVGARTLRRDCNAGFAVANFFHSVDGSFRIVRAMASARLERRSPLKMNWMVMS